MTDVVSTPAGVLAKPARRDIGIKRRYAAERRFRAYGIAALSFGILFLMLLLWSVVSKGYTAFQQTMITVPVEFSEQIIDKDNQRATDPQKLMTANYPIVARNAVAKALGVSEGDTAQLRAVNQMISNSVRNQLRDMVVANPQIIGTTQTVSLLAAGDIDSAFKGQINLEVTEQNRKISDQQVGWMNKLAEAGALGKHFNSGIFFNGASSRPEAAGVGVALIGSFYMMLIVLVLALPIGVAASISIAGTVQMLLALVLLGRKLGGLAVAPVARALAGYILAAVPALGVGLGTALALGAFTDGGFATTTVLGALVSMVVIGSVMSAVYFSVLVVMRSPDLQAAVSPITRRLRRR